MAEAVVAVAMIVAESGIGRSSRHPSGSCSRKKSKSRSTGRSRSSSGARNTSMIYSKRKGG